VPLGPRLVSGCCASSVSSATIAHNGLLRPGAQRWAWGHWNKFVVALARHVRVAAPLVPSTSVASVAPSGLEQTNPGKRPRDEDEPSGPSPPEPLPVARSFLFGNVDAKRLKPADDGPSERAAQLPLASPPPSFSPPSIDSGTKTGASHSVSSVRTSASALFDALRGQPPSLGKLGQSREAACEQELRAAAELVKPNRADALFIAKRLRELAQSLEEDAPAATSTSGGDGAHSTDAEAVSVAAMLASMRHQAGDSAPVSSPHSMPPTLTFRGHSADWPPTNHATPTLGRGSSSPWRSPLSHQTAAWGFPPAPTPASLQIRAPPLPSEALPAPRSKPRGKQSPATASARQSPLSSPPSGRVSRPSSRATSSAASSSRGAQWFSAATADDESRYEEFPAPPPETGPAVCAITLTPHFRDGNMVVYQRGRKGAHTTHNKKDTGSRDGFIALAPVVVKGLSLAISAVYSDREVFDRFCDAFPEETPGSDAEANDRVFRAARRSMFKEDEPVVKRVAVPPSEGVPLPELTPLQRIRAILASDGNIVYDGESCFRVAFVRVPDLGPSRIPDAALIVSNGVTKPPSRKPVQACASAARIDSDAVAHAIEPTWGVVTPLPTLARQDDAHAALLNTVWPSSASISAAFKRSKKTDTWTAVWPKLHWRMGEARWVGTKAVVLPFTLAAMNNSGQPDHRPPKSWLAISCAVKYIQQAPSRVVCCSAVSQPFSMMSCNETPRSVDARNNRRLAFLAVLEGPGPGIDVDDIAVAGKATLEFTADVAAHRVSPAAELALLATARQGVISRLQVLLSSKPPPAEPHNSDETHRLPAAQHGKEAEAVVTSDARGRTRRASALRADRVRSLEG
jgi:hypothetical protein